MYAAALHADWDPDEVSFVHTVNVIQRSQWRLMQASGSQRPTLRRALLQEVCQERVPPRRLRFQARVIKRTHSRYKRKWYAHLHAPCCTNHLLISLFYLSKWYWGVPLRHRIQRIAACSSKLNRRQKEKRRA